MRHTIRKFIVIFSLALLLAGCGRTQPQSAQSTPTQSGPVVNGQIRGIIYNDTNGNKTPDPGEPGLQERVGYGAGPCPVTNSKNIIYVDGNQDGTYLIKDLKPGGYCVFYAGDNAVTTKLTVDVNVPNGGEGIANFAVWPH
jgi:hypothetical protein